MKRKFAFLAFGAIVGGCTVNQPGLTHTGGEFISQQEFLNLPNEARIMYATGMADAFLFLEARGDLRTGLIECYSRNGTTPEKIDELLFRAIKGDQKREMILYPTAYVFELANIVGCVDLPSS